MTDNLPKRITHNNIIDGNNIEGEVFHMFKYLKYGIIHPMLNYRDLKSQYNIDVIKKYLFF